jgi:cellulose synthase/poly-beta-1,6-N-acetylglucosamine synthase-like glycosyltransferase
VAFEEELGREVRGQRLIAVAFTLSAWRRGFTCGRIHGIIREQSPTTLRDFLKQRRRWFMGIRDIKGMYGLPHLAVNLWTVGVFTLAVTVINLPFTLIDKSLTPFWLAICANFCFIVSVIRSYLEI